jgi:tRNA 2-thiouridine synthesizing protein A
MSDVRPATATDTEWNAGDLGCGELVLELRGRLQALAPGGVLRLIACDLGAPADIPAWCRLTGHVLVSSVPPVYLIRRKEQ